MKKHTAFFTSATIIALVGTPMAAQAGYEGQNAFLDTFCYHGSISNAGTKGTLTAKYYNGPTLLETVRNSPGRCGLFRTQTRWDMRSDGQTGRKVTHVELSTDSADAHFIDEARFYVSEKWTKKRGKTPSNAGIMASQVKEISYYYPKNNTSFGRDGGKGWCLSTQASDGNGDWAPYVGGCYSSLSFDTTTGKVYVGKIKRAARD
jgi:hypothetical protein